MTYQDLVLSTGDLQDIKQTWLRIALGFLNQLHFLLQQLGLSRLPVSGLFNHSKRVYYQMATQDDVVTNYQNIVSTSALVMRGDVLSYNQALTNILFEVAELDNSHRLAILSTDKTALLNLRFHLEGLLSAIQRGLQAGNF
jgi:hypothetical protein